MNLWVSFSQRIVDAECTNQFKNHRDKWLTRSLVKLLTSYPKAANLCLWPLRLNQVLLKDWVPCVTSQPHTLIHTSILILYWKRSTRYHHKHAFITKQWNCTGSMLDKYHLIGYFPPHCCLICNLFSKECVCVCVCVFWGASEATKDHFHVDLGWIDWFRKHLATIISAR